MPNVLVKLAWSARSWQGCRNGGTRGSEHSFPLTGPSLLRGSSSAHTIWRKYGKGGLGFFPSTPTLVEIPELTLHHGAEFLLFGFWESSTCELPPPPRGARWALGRVSKRESQERGAAWRICGAALGFQW